MISYHMTPFGRVVQFVSGNLGPEWSAAREIIFSPWIKGIKGFATYLTFLLTTYFHAFSGDWCVFPSKIESKQKSSFFPSQSSQIGESCKPNYLLFPECQRRALLILPPLRESFVFALWNLFGAAESFHGFRVIKLEDVTKGEIRKQSHKEGSRPSRNCQSQCQVTRYQIRCLPRKVDIFNFAIGKTVPSKADWKFFSCLQQFDFPFVNINDWCSTVW